MSRHVAVGGERGRRMSFDEQASSFDDRAGLPDSVAQDVAAAVLSIGGLGPADTLVEVGAGSGEIGCHFVRSVSYVGFDVSDGMLTAFRDRLHAKSHTARLAVADGDETWPVADGS